MKFGLSDKNYQFLFETLIEPLKKQGLTVSLFGSRARGQHHQYSDIDILLEGPLTSELRNQIRLIKEKFEESNFPYKIDLVHVDDLATSYKPGVLKDRIIIE